MRSASPRPAHVAAVRLLAWLLLPALALGLSSCASLSLQKAVTPSLGSDTWSSFDGKVMPYRQKTASAPAATTAPVTPEAKPRAIVITVHGLSGSATDFWMLEEEWPKQGIAVYGLQLRGQGNDPVKRARGDISEAEVWQKDLLVFHQLIADRHPGVPIFWFSESLGTLIALHTVTEQLPDPKLAPAGIIMSSPAAGLRLRPSGARATMLYAAIATVPFMKVNLEKLGGVNDKDIRVTHDTTHGAQMAITSHYVSHFTLRLLGEVDDMMRTALDAARRLRIPVLVLASPMDVIASEAQVQDFYSAIGSRDKTIHWYRESYHLLLHDKQREEVFRHATDWLQRHIRQRG